MKIQLTYVVDIMAIHQNMFLDTERIVLLCIPRVMCGHVACLGQWNLSWCNNDLCHYPHFVFFWLVIAEVSFDMGGAVSLEQSGMRDTVLESYVGQH